MIASKRLFNNNDININGSLLCVQTLNNVTSTVMIYYIQNQFIPLHKLEFKSHLEDRSFGEVWHAQYSGIDVTVKRAKFDFAKDRKIMYKIYLHEAEVFRFVILLSTYHPLTCPSILWYLLIFISI